MLHMITTTIGITVTITVRMSTMHIVTKPGMGMGPMEVTIATAKIMVTRTGMDMNTPIITVMSTAMVIKGFTERLKQWQTHRPIPR